MGLRDLAKGEEAKKCLHDSLSQYAEIIQVWPLDQAYIENVRSFARKIENELDRLDIFIANAGVSRPDWEVTGDGCKHNSTSYGT